MYADYITSLLMEGVAIQKINFKTLKKRYPAYDWGKLKVKEVWESNTNGATQYYFFIKDGNWYKVYFAQERLVFSPMSDMVNCKISIDGT